MAKWYAVRKGNNPGIYATWADCERQVKGFSGAEFKSFQTEAEALAYMGDSGEDLDTAVIEINDLCTQDVLIAYTDGSFTAGDPPKSGFGICFVKNGKEIGHCFGPSDADTSSRNVGGELMAATRAIEIAQQLLEPELIICHDFKNIQMWGDGIWKCNTEQTKAFRECVRQARENGLSITFGWVRGHTGNEFNEKADQYAALGAEGKSESPII